MALMGVTIFILFGLYVPLPLREPDHNLVTQISPFLKDVAKVELTELYFDRMDLARGKETDLKTLTLSEAQQARIIGILGNSWAPLFTPGGVGVFCHDPHHRLRFYSHSGSVEDLYVCFGCANVSLGSREGYTVERDTALSGYMYLQLHSFVFSTLGPIKPMEEYAKLEFPNQ